MIRYLEETTCGVPGHLVAIDEPRWAGNMMDRIMVFNEGPWTEMTIR